MLTILCNNSLFTPIVYRMEFDKTGSCLGNSDKNCTQNFARGGGLGDVGGGEVVGFGFVGAGHWGGKGRILTEDRRLFSVI